MGSPQAKREAVSLLMTERDFGVIRACGLLQISRALYRYRSRRAGCAGLGERIAESAADCGMFFGMEITSKASTTGLRGSPSNTA